MDIVEEGDLSLFNTMALPAKAAFRLTAHATTDIVQAIQFSQEKKLPLYCLGGGSNVIIKNDINAVVLLLANKGIHLIEETQDDVLVSVAAGEVWDNFLQYCLDQHWYGLENLAIIPGTVGASPIQNIGAYGQEVSDCIASVTFVDIASLQVKKLKQQECQFSYRESIFKSQLASKCVIQSVEFRLAKTFIPNLTYTALAEQLCVKTCSALALRNAVIQLRQSKLPDPAILPNCGSFFKNPILSIAQADALKQTFPQLPVYEYSNQQVKIAAGWLIERAGWRGKQLGAVGVHKDQALVLVNYGGATFSELAQLIAAIKTDVKNMFDIHLIQEPIEMGS